jgi:hypothetical protein
MGSTETITRQRVKQRPGASLSWPRIGAIFIARNREFYRDMAGLI